MRTPARRRPIGADLGVLRRVTSRRARRWRHLQLGRLFRKLDERPGDRLFVVAFVRIEPAKADQFAGHVRRNVEAYNHDALLSLLAPSARALGPKAQLPDRFRVCLTHAGRVAGLAWFPHARPHCRVQPGLWSYGLPKQARERGESFAHREREYHVTRVRSTLSGVPLQLSTVETLGLSAAKRSPFRQRYRPGDRVATSQPKAARCASCRAHARKSERGHAPPRRDPSADRARANPTGSAALLLVPPESHPSHRSAGRNRRRGNLARPPTPAAAGVPHVPVRARFRFRTTRALSEGRS